MAHQNRAVMERFEKSDIHGPKHFTVICAGCCCAECTKIARRRSLAIFIADEGIARNSATSILTHSLRRRNRGSLANFLAEEITHLGVSKNRAIFRGVVKKNATAAAENRGILVHSVAASRRFRSNHVLQMRISFPRFPFL